MFRLDQQHAGRVADVAGKRHGQHRVGVRIGRQREPVSHRRDQFHLSLSGRVARRADRGCHPGSPRAVDGRIGRVRQHAGRRVQRRDEAGRRSLRGRNVVLRAVVRPDGAADRPPGHARAPSRRAATSGSGIAISRRASAARSSAIGCGSSARISTSATTTVSPARTLRFRDGTSRTRSSASSRGG